MACGACGGNRKEYRGRRGIRPNGQLTCSCSGVLKRFYEYDHKQKKSIVKFICQKCKKVFKKP